VNRNTDLPHTTRFRSERYFRSDGQWFFNTREGTTEGPFPTREAAHAALTDYLLAIGIKPGDVWALVGDHR